MQNMAIRENETAREGQATSGKWIGLVLYVVAALQNVSIASFGNLTIKPIHLLCLIVIPLAIGKRPTTRASTAIMLGYLGSVLFLSLIGYLLYPPSSLIVNYIFVFVLVWTLAKIASSLSYFEILKGFKLGASAILGYSVINTIRQDDAVELALTYSAESGARPQIEQLVYAGGINIEASWIALASAFFIRQPKQFVLYSIPAVLLIGTLASRTALIIYLIILFSAVWKWTSAAKYRIQIRLGLVIVCSISITLLQTVFSGMRVIQRMQAVGNEPGSNARSGLWEAGLQAFAHSPLIGYGIGNEITAAEQFSRDAFIEDNLHNLYLSNAVSTGILGLIAYCLMLMGLVVIARRRPELWAFVLAFGVGCFFEFRGADVPFYAVVCMLAASLLNQDSDQLEEVGTVKRSRFKFSTTVQH